MMRVGLGAATDELPVGLISSLTPVSAPAPVAPSVFLGSGGSAYIYTVDPATGLTNDPRLAPYLQNLTPSQLQTALNGDSPNQDLISLLYQDLTATGAGSLPCSDPATCNPTSPTPAWVWVLALGIAGLIAVEAMK